LASSCSLSARVAQPRARRGLSPSPLTARSDARRSYSTSPAVSYAARTWGPLLDRHEKRFGYRSDGTMVALLYDQGRAAAEAMINAPVLTGPGMTAASNGSR
jgi:hypothetical protein